MISGPTAAPRPKAACIQFSIRGPWRIARVRVQRRRRWSQRRRPATRRDDHLVHDGAERVAEQAHARRAAAHRQHHADAEAADDAARHCRGDEIAAREAGEQHAQSVERQAERGADGRPGDAEHALGQAEADKAKRRQAESQDVPAPPHPGTACQTPVVRAPATHLPIAYALIQRGGGKRPDEARQPSRRERCSPGDGANSADALCCSSRVGR